MTATDHSTSPSAAPASIADERGFAHCQRLRVRYAETDAMGVVYHANYVTFFEVGRVEYLRAAGIDYRSLEDAKMTGAVVEANVRFHAPARFDDELDLTARIARLGTTSMSTAIEILKVPDGSPVVQGEIHHVFIDPVAYTKRSIPEDVRAGLEPYLVETAEAPA